MCGIVGVMGHNLGFGDLAKFKDLMVLAQLRGDEGAGMIAVPKKAHVEQVRVTRTTWSSGHLVTTKDFDDCVKGDTNILIGHARAPTRGGTDIKNVHPHRAGQVILVHNGTMTYVNDQSVPTGASDSRLVCKTIEEKGVQHFVDSSYGAYCLVWIDLRDQTLNFLRNDQRPLALCRETMSSMPQSQLTKLWWSSEAWMVNIALSRYQGYVKEKFTTMVLPVDEHWKFPLDVKMMLGEPEVTPIKRKTFSMVSTGYPNWEAWMDENEPAPFSGAANKSGSNESKQSSTKVGTTSAPFSYVPPEHRARGIGVDVSAANNQRFVNPEYSSNPSTILQLSFNKAKQNKSKREIDERVAAEVKKGQTNQSDTFSEKLQYYCAKEPKAILDRLHSGPCVWCSNTPAYSKDKLPRIFPIKFSDTRGEYVCEGCMSDLDVQRMVGLG